MKGRKVGFICRIYFFYNSKLKEMHILVNFFKITCADVYCLKFFYYINID